MNYERTILEMMSRIQALEEQVAKLMNQSSQDKGEKDMTLTNVANVEKLLKTIEECEGKEIWEYLAQVWMTMQKAI